MTVYKIFPEKDATMYSLFPAMNTGLDEILEAGNLNLQTIPNPQVSRALVKFNQDEINNVFSSLISSSNWSANLRLFIATAQSVDTDYELEIYPISGSWVMGTGKYLDNPISTNGCSWKWRTFVNGTAWPVNPSLSQYVTASYSGSNTGGGNWFTGSTHTLPVTSSQTFNYRSDKDLNAPVKGIVAAWYSSSNAIGSATNIANEGFLVKWEDAIEFNPNPPIQPVLQYYSVDTHTIYPPTLELKWNDFSYVTSSTIPTIATSQLYASIINNDGFFYSQSVQQFRVDCRPQFPAIIFQTASIYTTNYYLPTASFWAIKDLDTNEYVIDFDPVYTKLSADTTSSYFEVYMNGLQPERYYTILLKTTVEGSTLVFDSNYNFKVING